MFNIFLLGRKAFFVFQHLTAFKKEDLMNMGCGWLTSCLVVFLLSLFVQAGAPVAASEKPMSASLNDQAGDVQRELQELEKQGRITVRTLRAWGLLPEKYVGVAFRLREQGHDLFSSTSQQVRELSTKAQENFASLHTEDIVLLQELAEYMESRTYLQIEPDHVGLADALADGNTEAVSTQPDVSILPDSVDQDAMMDLVQQTLTSFSQSLHQGSMSHFHASLALQTRQIFSLAIFDDIFQEFMILAANEISWEGIVPVLDRSALITDEGLLMFSGMCPHDVEPLHFTLLYQPEDEQWKVYSASFEIVLNVEHDIRYSAYFDTKTAQKEMSLTEAQISDHHVATDAHVARRAFEEMPPARIETIAQQTELDFFESIRSRDMGHFYTTLSRQWQAATSPEELNSAFASLIASDAAVPYWNPADFALAVAPMLADDVVMYIAGYYDLQPVARVVDQVYVLEQGEWKLVGYHQELRPFNADWETLTRKAVLFSGQGDVEQALQAAKQAFRIANELNPSEPLLTLLSLRNLAGLYTSKMDFASAIPLRLTALFLKEKMYGLEDFTIAEELEQLQVAYLMLGRMEEAALCEQWSGDVRAAVSGDAKAASRLRVQENWNRFREMIQVQDVSSQEKQELLELQRLAEFGDAEAQFQLASVHLEGRLGRGVDAALAFQLLSSAAEQGHVQAQNALGGMLAAGRGIERDYSQAGYWFALAAGEGHADAQNSMGVLLENGWGVDRDFVQAVQWYRKAAEQENVMAQYNLGRIYLHGLGVDQDYGKATEWFQKAAVQNHPAAQYNLGLNYEHGNGVPQDLDLALGWYHRALANGHEGAAQKVESLKRSSGISR